MPFSVFSHLFLVERARQRIKRSATAAGFATPALGEIDINATDTDPLLATNMRGTFLLTRKTPNGIARYGFSPCFIEEEGVLATELAIRLWDGSETCGWDIRCKSVPEAVESFGQASLEPRTLVVSAALARGILGQEAPVPEGLAGTVNRMQVLVTSLPETVALVALAPVSAGLCVRMGDSIGIIMRPKAFRVVRT
jgi:hypothetical protein